MSINNIDFNTDITRVTDSEIYDFVSTINVPCLYLPNNRLNIKTGITICKEKNMTISALLTADDMLKDENAIKNLDENEVEALVLTQLGALLAYTKAYSLTVDTVRPTGLLYKAASNNFDVALNIVKAVQKVDKWINYTCADNEVADRLESETTIPVNREIIVDGIYKTDGNFDFDNTNFASEEDVLNRIKTILHSSRVEIGEGEFKTVKCSTLHFNSENPDILNLLKKANEIVVPSQPNYNKAELSGWL